MERNMKKIALIGFMTVICGLVSLCIKSILKDRVSLSEVTQFEVSESWSGSQNFIAPMLCVPICEEGKTTPHECMYIMPDQLNVDAKVTSETLHRGIFDASVYRSIITAKGTYNLKDMVTTAYDEEIQKNIVYDWSRVQIVVGISDYKGIEEGLAMTLKDNKVELNHHFNNYGNSKMDPILANTQVPICGFVDLTDQLNSELSFSLTANIKGAGELFFSQIARNSEITVHGNCPDPSFTGSSLPSWRDVKKDGFTATWKVFGLRHEYDDQVIYTDGNRKIEPAYIGTKLLVRGGQYTQTDRALKYAFLVILLSLIAVFVGEMSVGSEINSLNYLLISAALVLFYLMLLSLAEWIGFGLAYLVSTILILGMIALYLKAIVHDKKTVTAICLFMGLVDVFIYILLSIADMALLVGTFGLFFILGIAMFFSLKFKFQNMPTGTAANIEKNDDDVKLDINK